MGLLILIVVGALLGWLATIILRIEDGRSIAFNTGAGIAGTVVTGLVVGTGAILGSISGATLLWSVVGALVTIALFNLIRRHAFSA
ncbi:GlsB/YeaQ/YmgE family stress response membrane protein [Qipengyuania flava]|uniref:GlsB/YeaQ/YmgE family stress response membrane protein n=1 Tax=Qipengyuania flava TaxID=192812 RepID=UPI001C636188|nr:GlsB/YeaQ/YmgE family stress response membrane protein [Qipengyuania flava]QYJ07474.1 GlsB/YeaQ/YmgE family stress response membrane protein [Qipengyuania flava]